MSIDQLLPDYVGDAQRAYDHGKQRQQADIEQQKSELGELAGYLLSVPEEQRAAVWQSQVAPRVEKLIPGAGREAYGPHVADIAQWAVQQYGRGSQAQAAPAQQRYLQFLAGQVPESERQDVYRNAAGTNPRARSQIYDGADGAVNINTATNTAVPVTMAGPQMPPQAPQQPGVQFDFAPGTSPQIQAAMRTYASADQAQQGQQLQPAKNPAEAERLAMERERLRLAQNQDAREASAAQDTGGAPDPGEVDFYATMSNAGDYSWATGMARGKSGQALIAAVRKRQVELAGANGMGATDVTANRASSQALQKTLVDRQKYVTAVEQLNGTLNRQANLVESLMNKGAANGQSPIINRWIQSGRKSVAGDPDVAAFDAAIRGLGREHQRVLTGPLSNAQLAVSASETADTLLNRDMTPAQIRATINVMRTEARNGKEQGEATLNDLRGQLRNMGKPAGAGGKQIKRTGTHNGRRVVEYTDGTISYAD